MTFKMTKPLSILFSSLVLSACATKVPPPPEGTPTMSQAYSASMINNANVVNDNNGNIAPVYNRQAKVTVPSLAGALQNPQLLERQAEFNDGFPMLPNPQVMVYIYPHFQEGMPLHGNWTTFSLYEQNYYALPSEVNTGNNITTYK